MVSVLVDSFYQKSNEIAHAADITHWIASTPEQITNNLTTQNHPQQLNGQQYLIQWGDTLVESLKRLEFLLKKNWPTITIFQNIDLIFAGDVLVLKRDGDVPEVIMSLVMVTVVHILDCYQLSY